MVNKYPKVGYTKNINPYEGGSGDSVLYLRFPLSLGVCAVTGRHSFPSKYPDEGGQAGHAHTKHPDRWVCLAADEVTHEIALHEIAHLLDPAGGKYHSFGWRMMMKQLGAKVPLRYEPWPVRTLFKAKLQWRTVKAPETWLWPYRLRWYRRVKIGVPLARALRQMPGEPL